jgi:hypothetical protein
MCCGCCAVRAVSRRWDVSELCLELLFGILLRNRDRFAALWPAVYEHLLVRGWPAG